MNETNNRRNFDVIISGAGPAGCACALSLKESGLKVAVFDKMNFPRDKVCGDAIPGRAVRVLGQIDPRFEEAFRNFPGKLLTRKTRVIYKEKWREKAWVREAYTCSRLEFDHFLFSLVRDHAGATVFTGTGITGVQVDEGAVQVAAGPNNDRFTASVIVGADGAHSAVARQLGVHQVDRKHYVASVRGYYENVEMHGPDQTEVFLDKRFLPGYFWLFPLPGNRVNAGFGMLSHEVARRKINIRHAFHDFIQSTHNLKERFRQARPTSPLEGFGLPLGSRRMALSGPRYLLAGDAGSLIDPVSGDGIGNAMLSGRLAALQIIQSFQHQDFSPTFMQAYDQALDAAIGRELRTNTLLLRMGEKMPFLLDLAFLAARKEHP